MATGVTWARREAIKEEAKARFEKKLASPSCAAVGVMYEAFELQKLVEKLPLKICALATWGESHELVIELLWWALIGTTPLWLLSLESTWPASSLNWLAASV